MHDGNNSLQTGDTSAPFSMPAIEALKPTQVRQTLSVMVLDNNVYTGETRPHVPCHRWCAASNQPSSSLQLVRTHITSHHNTPHHITRTGKLYSVGTGSVLGQGVGEDVSVSEPALVAFPSPTVKIAGVAAHTHALAYDTGMCRDDVNVMLHRHILPPVTWHQMGGCTRGARVSAAHWGMATTRLSTPPSSLRRWPL